MLKKIPKFAVPASALNFNTDASNYLNLSASNIDYQQPFAQTYNPLQFPFLQQNTQVSFQTPDIKDVLKTLSLNSSDLIINNAATQARQNAESKHVSSGDSDGKGLKGPQISNKAAGYVKGASQISKGVFDSTASILGFQKNDTMDSIYSSASDIAKQFGPYGQIAGMAIDAWNFIDKGLGKLFTNDKLQKGFDGRTGSSSYADFSTQGKTLRLTQLGAQDKLLAQRNAKAEQYANAMGNVLANKQATQARSQATQNVNTRFLNQKSGAVSGSLLTAKNGGVLKSIKTVISKTNRNFIINSPIYTKDLNLSSDKEINEDIKMFKDGGAVIPSGALHKNKHHLEEIDESLNKNITSKGIPVITIEDGGEIKQHAEIEKEEIILSLSLTKQIEKLWKEGSEEAAIEAGKLFTNALMEDTEDNVGLIEKVKNENKG